MGERWPRCMKRTTAAEYLDVGLTTFDELVNTHKIGSVQYTERGDRRYLRDDLDALLETLSGRKVNPRAA